MAPVIGRDFDSVMGQQRGWYDFNRGVDEANLSRLAAAQQTRNNWLQQIQALQQQQADRQYQADEQGQANMLAMAQQARAEQEARREFDVTSGIRRAAITAKTDAVTKAMQDANTQAENYGTTTADELADVGGKMERSLSEKTDAQSALASGIAKLSATLPPNKVTLNKSGTMFVLRPNTILTTEEKQNLDTANAELADTYSTLKDAETQHADSSKSFSQLVKEASSYGLAARKKGDTWGLYHSSLNRWYLPKSKPATASAATEENPPSRWFGGMPGGMPAQSPFNNLPQVWPGFSDTTGTEAAQPETFKIGRFTVSAQ